MADKPPQRIGLFGGSFNPPHVAHQLVCTLALSRGRVDEVWLMPCHQHAFVKELTDFDDRVVMCQRAAEPFGGRVKVTDVERVIGGVSRTVVTLEHLHRVSPEILWTLIVGSDILAEAHRWTAWERIQELATLFVVPRRGTGDGQSVALPDIASSTIRQRLSDTQPVGDLLPTGVLEYIQDRGLYR